MLMGLPGGERAKPGTVALMLPGGTMRTQSIPPDPPGLATLPASHFFPQPLATHDCAPLSWETQKVSTKNAIWIGACLIQDRTG